MGGLRRIAAILCGALLLCGCGEGYNEVIAALDSPDGKHTTVVFSRDLGATTRTSYHLSVVKSNASVGSGGNAFVSYHAFEVAWIDDGTLLVHCDTQDIYKQKDRVGAITVTYSYTEEERE